MSYETFLEGRMMAPKIFRLLLAALAAYRAALMVTGEHGPYMVFARLRSHFPPVDWKGEGIRCLLCVSFWFSLLTALYVPGDRKDYILRALGVAGIVAAWEQFLNSRG